MRIAALAVLEYLLGFLALALFAFLAFGGGPATDDRLLFAFKASAPVAVFELAVLFWRTAPANRLILGANLWLAAGGLAAFLQQWWWLKGYQQLGEASLFISMGIVGLATTALSPAGFVAAAGHAAPLSWLRSPCLLAYFWRWWPQFISAATSSSELSYRSLRCPGSTGCCGERCHVGPNMSVNRSLHGMAPWPRVARCTCCASRPGRHAVPARLPLR